MIEQISEALTFTAHFTVAGAAGTGLTVTCTVYKMSDATALVTAQAATEVGNGLYKYALAANLATTAGEYFAVFNEAADTADLSSVPSRWTISPQWVSDLGSATVVTAGPVLTTADTLEIVRADDYNAADGRAISFQSDSWPDLTSATITMTIRRRKEAFGTGSDQVLATKADTPGSRIVGAGSQTVYFDLTTTETTPLLPGTLTGKYDVQATLANTDIVTLITGLVSVTEDQTRA